MATYSTWESLAAAAQTAAASILEKEVAPKVKEIVDRHIQTDIYGSYSPVGSEFGGYDRRGALGNPANTQEKIIDDNTLVVTNNAPPSPSLFNGGSSGHEDELLYWIENGLVPNHFNNNDYAWMHPRPAIENSQKEINGSAEIKGAINQGLKRVFGK